MRFIAECMREFNETYTEVTFDLYSNTADHIKERLEKGLLDIIGTTGSGKTTTFINPTVQILSQSAAKPSIHERKLYQVCAG